VFGDKLGDMDAAIAAGVGHTHLVARHDLTSAIFPPGQQLDKTT
jgi:uncharacterized protein YjlB